MRKRTFWPIVVLVFGLIILATNSNLLPLAFMNLWPMILVIIGLGGILTSDREEWLSDPAASRASKPKKPSRKR